jgi:hypothetical protein
MAKLQASTSFGLGGTSTTESVFSKNHFSSETTLSPEVRQKIASMGLNRVAGNAYICESTKDFWQVRGNKIIRLTIDEVDNGETLAAAPVDNPMNFLNGIMGDLTF